MCIARGWWATKESCWPAMVSRGTLMSKKHSRGRPVSLGARLHGTVFNGASVLLKVGLESMSPPPLAISIHQMNLKHNFP